MKTIVATFYVLCIIVCQAHELVYDVAGDYSVPVPAAATFVEFSVTGAGGGGGTGFVTIHMELCAGGGGGGGAIIAGKAPVMLPSSIAVHVGRGGCNGTHGELSFIELGGLVRTRLVAQGGDTATGCDGAAGGSCPSMGGAVTCVPGDRGKDGGRGQLQTAANVHLRPGECGRDGKVCLTFHETRVRMDVSQ
jgi:hypothetical protein